MLIGLVIGAIGSLLLIVIFNVAFAFVDLIVRDAEVTSAVKLVITGLLSFQFIYIIKLLGLEDVVSKS